jgi:NADH:ubiquinone reductase (H+-translocating)
MKESGSQPEAKMNSPNKHRVVILGGGFAGLNAATSLRYEPVEVTLIDKRNFHLFQPLLYQVATGGLSPANIAAPLRAVLKRQRNTKVLLSEVQEIDPVAKTVTLDEGTKIPYDSLLVATGAGTSYFNHPEWEAVAPGLKTIEDATEIRRRILSAFEQAEKCTDPKKRQDMLTFVIVGGGPTGVEMAGAISELARVTMRNDFRSIDPSIARILLVEGHNRVLQTFPEKLSAAALDALHHLEVETWLSSKVLDVQPDYVRIDHEGKEVQIGTSVVVWAAGVKASPLTTQIAKVTGATTDRGGRIPVQPNLTIANFPDIYVLGDAASCAGKDGKPLPGVAPVASQQGCYVAKLIGNKLRNAEVPAPFEYWDKGSMATIGRHAAVVDLYWFQFSGWFAWVTWLFVHIMYLVQFQNRFLVLSQWTWNYLTRNRAARLITRRG